MIEAKQVVKTYRTKGTNGSATVNAVNGVDFIWEPGEFCVLVGESGSGKSTLSQLLMGLISPTSGELLLDGKSIAFSRKHNHKELFTEIQLVLQDGKSSLDPRYSVYDCIAEPLRNLKRINRAEEKRQIQDLLKKMELPQELLTRKAHELSGGQQKRVCIARALAAHPQYIIFDEAVSGLDVLVRKSVLDLLEKLHREQNIAFLFITHDMDVALYLANRILVMKDGFIVEDVPYTGDTSCFHHPYSRLLLNSVLPRQAATSQQAV